MRRENPLVTIAVPFYNVERYIERCIRSLFEQTYDNIEYVFVDDCSPDRSIEIVRKTLKEYPNRISQVKIIHHEKNRGIAAARNTAITNSTGVFITHVDSDDWVELDYVESLVDLQQDSGADIVSSNTFCHLRNKVIIGDTYTSLNNTPLENIIMHKAAFHIWGRLILLNLYTNNGIVCKEGVNQGEDLQVLPLLAYYSQKHVCVNKPLYHYNAENNNAYSFKERYKLKDIIQLRESFGCFYSFFMEKEPIRFGTLLAKRKMDYLYYLMKLSVYVKSKETFSKFKHELTHLETKNDDIAYHDIIHKLRKSYLCTKILLLIRDNAPIIFK